MLPKSIRVDKGTETVVMTTMHCYLQQKLNNVGDATETVLYGPSTQNKIERWWRELLERMETYFNDQLNELLESGDYDPSNETHRYCVPHCQMLVAEAFQNRALTNTLLVFTNAFIPLGQCLHMCIYPCYQQN